MSLEDRDAAYLWDMLQAANEVVEMIGDHDLDSFLRNHILQRAIERCVEIIGEVARRVSDPGRAATPEIPWREIIGQRNILPMSMDRSIMNCCIKRRLMIPLD